MSKHRLYVPTHSGSITEEQRHAKFWILDQNTGSHDECHSVVEETIMEALLGAGERAWLLRSLVALPEDPS